jgi:hypothetical protein
MSKIVAETSHFEGGDMTWTNRRGDAGKETVGGISRVHWPKEEVWRWLDPLKEAWAADFRSGAAVDLRDYHDREPNFVAAIQRCIHDFYHARGWLYKPADPSRRVHVTDIDSQAVAAALYDILFNGGRGMLKPCVRALQKHLGITADGICGKGTAARVNFMASEMLPTSDHAHRLINEKATRDILAVLAQRQVEYYCRIVQKKVTQLAALAAEYDGENAYERGYPHDADAVASELYAATDAGNLVGWCANRAFKGLL